MDKDDGWFYSSASVVDEGTNTIYICLSDSLATGHLYAIKDRKILIDLDNTKPYIGLTLANGILYGGYNNQKTLSAAIDEIDPTTLKVKSTLATMPDGWLLLSTHGFAHDEYTNIFYLWCANMFNATIDYASIFGVDG